LTHKVESEGAKAQHRAEKTSHPTKYEYCGSLISLQPHNDSWFVAQGRTVLRTGRNGFIPDGSPYGLFVCETRLLSKYEMRIDGKELLPVALSNVNQHSWAGYYVMLPPGADPGPADKGSGDVQAYSENTLEVRITRTAADGIHEDIDIVNYSLESTSFELQFYFDADFASVTEADSNRRRTSRSKKERWSNEPLQKPQLIFHCKQSHKYKNQGEKGQAEIDRGLKIAITAKDCAPRYGKERISIPIKLNPGASWHACLDFVPWIEEWAFSHEYLCYAFHEERSRFTRLRDESLQKATHFASPAERHLRSVVTNCIRQATRDLVALRQRSLLVFKDRRAVEPGHRQQATGGKFRPRQLHGDPGLAA